jgi:hypothetical protein
LTGAKDESQDDEQTDRRIHADDRNHRCSEEGQRFRDENEDIKAVLNRIVEVIDNEE